MAKKRNKKQIPYQISPIVWGYVYSLKNQGVPITQAWLFGSWAKGKQHKWSDIDLAIISPKFKNWWTANKIMHKARKIEELMPIETHGFHPDDFDPAENSVAYEVMKYGIRII